MLKNGEISFLSKTLFLMRHAKADFSFIGQDTQRPLSEKGRQEQKTMGLFLSKKGLNLEKIYHSPLVRTTESARLLSKSFPKTQVIEEFLLGNYFNAEKLLEKLSKDSFNSILLLGHEPSLAFLVHKFLKKQVPFEFANSSVIELKFDEKLDWEKGKFIAYYDLRQATEF